MIKVLFNNYVVTPLQTLWFYIVLIVLKCIPKFNGTVKVRVYNNVGTKTFIPEFKDGLFWSPFYERRIGYYLYNVLYKIEFKTFNEATLYLRKKEEQWKELRNEKVSKVVIEETWKGL